MRAARAPRGRSRGGIRGSSRGAPGRGSSFSRGRGTASSHFAPKRGGFVAPHTGRPTKRSYADSHSTRSTFEHQTSGSRHYGEPAEKYYSYSNSSSSRGSYKPKYASAEDSSSYHHRESHRSPSPRRRSHSDYYQAEAPSHRSSSHYRGDQQEERFERHYERYDEHRPQERYQSSSYRGEVEIEEAEPPPPPLIPAEEYLPAPKVVPLRGRGAARGAIRAPFRTYGSSTVTSSQKATLFAKKRLAIARGRPLKRPTYTKVARPRVFEVNPDCPDDRGPDVDMEEEDADDNHSPHRSRIPPRTRTGLRFIPLQCPHCKLSCTTFQQYKVHLVKKRHIIAMTKIEADLKQKVLSLRAQQRKQQNEEEENPDPEKPLSEFTSFCPICKLNYRQSKEVHENSDMHVKIKKFLYPTCSVCNIKFKSTRLYEQHMCSLEHIRTVANLKELEKRKNDGDEVGEIDREALDCLEGFMVVDSVGEDDDELEKEVLFGVDRIKTVEALFCDLCQRFLPRLDDVEKAKSVHCRSSLHKKNFEIDEKNKARLAEEEKKEEKVEEKPEEKEEAVVEEENKDDEKSSEKEEVADDETIWRDVDRDIGELLKDRNDDAVSSNNSNEEAQLSPTN